jgi:hypothetical protein
MLHAQYGDEWWIREIARLGYSLLTCDMAIASGWSERTAVIESGLRYLGFANAEYDGWVQLGAVNRHWTRLRDELNGPGPVISKLYAGSTVSEVNRPPASSGKGTKRH